MTDERPASDNDVDVTIAIDDASPSEADALAAIWHLGWIDGHAETASPELLAARSRDDFLLRMRTRIASVRVARRNGSIAGFHIVEDAELEQIYVDRAHRGAGVAQALLASAEQQIADAGHPQAWLAVVAGNDRARAFYAKQGWHDLGRFDYQAAGTDDPITVPCHRYAKTFEPTSST